MPRFHFDVRDRTGFHRDDVGDEFDDFEEAVAQAQAILANLATEEMPDGDVHEMSCQVRDETSGVVYRGELTFRGQRHRAGQETG